mmetsp:Transcript_64/g.185  ORF Transcript_64/g.185 Transcript_64/m.185 type:complete len:103 (-) Transcript_64:1309-1617(-)
MGRETHGCNQPVLARGFRNIERRCKTVLAIGEMLLAEGKGSGSCPACNDRYVQQQEQAKGGCTDELIRRLHSGMELYGQRMHPAGSLPRSNLLLNYVPCEWC